MRADNRPFILPFDAITPKTQKPLTESIVFENLFEILLNRRALSWQRDRAVLRDKG